MMIDVIKELKLAKDTFRIWSYLSLSDIKNRFRRSKFGILWPILHQLSFSLGAGVIWATVFSLEYGEFIPFLTLGFSIWGFISGCLMEGTAVFTNAGSYLKQLALPHSIFIFRAVFTQLIYLLIGVGTAFSVLAFFGKLTILGLLYSFPGFLLLFFAGYGTIGTIAYLGVRFRDLQHGLTGILSLLFVISPVIYPAEVLVERGLGFVIFANPLASFIEIVRYPLLNNTFVHSNHYWVAGITTCFLLVCRFFIARIWGRYVAFWL